MHCRRQGKLGGRAAFSPFLLNLILHPLQYNMPELQHLAVTNFLMAGGSSPEQADMAEAAALAWEAPGATLAIQDVIINYAVKRDNLYDGRGTDSAFD